MDYIDYAVNALPTRSIFTSFQLFGHDYYASIQLYLRLSRPNCLYEWIGDGKGRHNYRKL